MLKVNRIVHTLFIVESLKHITHFFDYIFNSPSSIFQWDKSDNKFFLWRYCNPKFLNVLTGGRQ